MFSFKLQKIGSLLKQHKRAESQLQTAKGKLENGIVRLRVCSVLKFTLRLLNLSLMSSFQQAEADVVASAEDVHAKEIVANFLNLKVQAMKENEKEMRDIEAQEELLRNKILFRKQELQQRRIEIKSCTDPTLSRKRKRIEQSVTVTEIDDEDGHTMELLDPIFHDVDPSDVASSNLDEADATKLNDMMESTKL